MKLQISLRTLLIVITFVGIGLAWYAKQAATRAAELQTMQRLQKLCGNISVSHSNDTVLLGCGNYLRSGCEIDTVPCGTILLNWLDLDAFKRVTRIEMWDEDNPQVIAELSAFKNLKAVSFYSNYSFYSPQPDVATTVATIESLRQFQARHPTVKVDFSALEKTVAYLTDKSHEPLWGFELPSETAAEPRESIINSADVDPFQ